MYRGIAFHPSIELLSRKLNVCKVAIEKFQNFQKRVTDSSLLESHLLHSIGNNILGIINFGSPNMVSKSGYVKLASWVRVEITLNPM